MIKGLHHAAYRCRDSEQTRAFYEDFLGLPMIEALAIGKTKTGRSANVLHTFFQMEDGSCMAFFEAPEQAFEFKQQHDFDLHIALTVNLDELQPMLERAQAFGIEARGIADHGSVQSVYFRDPNGYVVELAAASEKSPSSAPADAREAAHGSLERWQASKAQAVA